MSDGSPPDLHAALAEVHRHLERIEHSVTGDARRLREPGPHTGEQRWPVALAVAVAVALQLVLPDRLSIGPRWLLPALEGALLVGLTAANPRRIDRRSRALRGASIALIALVSLANGFSTVQLVHGLIAGTAGKAAGPLLSSGGSIYLTNIIVFGLWYWEMDAGGPMSRVEGEGRNIDLLFPQTSQPQVAVEGWRPTFFDYLFTSYTNATAFSPTDVMPLTHRAKALFALQSAISLATVALVVARAVNILS